MVCSGVFPLISLHKYCGLKCCAYLYKIVYSHSTCFNFYSKTCLKLSLKKMTGFQGKFSLNADQNYCKMLQGKHFAIISIFIKLPFVIKTFVLSFFG